MTYATRRKSSTTPAYALVGGGDEGCSSSSSDDESSEGEAAVVVVGRKEKTQGVSKRKTRGEEEEDDARLRAKEAKPAPITLSLKKVCKVCKGTGHEAGFKGATYVDCPKKPCFLCKMPGHTTISCPHRAALENGAVPARDTRGVQTHFDYVFQRQMTAGVPALKPSFVITDEVDCGVIKLHSRRVTCLEFHPTKSGILLSGDKKGQLGVWDYGKLHQKTVYGSIHSCILNNMKFNPSNDGMLYSSSSDGTVCYTDIETGIPLGLMDLNPDGWNGPASWRMLYGLDVHAEKNLLLVADNFGFMYMLDMRSQSHVGKPLLIHKKGSKVVGLHCNPLHQDILISCGNDHFARIWDVRRLDEGEPSLANLMHGRVVNSAYFSPLSGTKILTTSQDNRIRVWDSIYGNLEYPSREIVHSHDFNRHLTPFRAEWDPKDPSESLAIIGRYISENYDGVALHPIDFFDTTTGQLVAEAIQPDITTISPVNKPHPREDVVASGSSRSIFIWKPKEAACEDGQQKRRKSSYMLFGGEKDGKSRDCDSEDDFESNPKKSMKHSKPMSKGQKMKKPPS